MAKNTHTYSAHNGSHTGTTGFTNHWPGTADQIARALERVFADHGDVVVLDGDDDWYASESRRPESIARIFGITPVAWFHTGISGIAKSGIVGELWTCRGANCKQIRIVKVEGRRIEAYNLTGGGYYRIPKKLLGERIELEKP